MHEHGQMDDDKAVEGAVKAERVGDQRQGPGVFDLVEQFVLDVVVVVGVELDVGQEAAAGVGQLRERDEGQKSAQGEQHVNGHRAFLSLASLPHSSTENVKYEMNDVCSCV